MKPLLAHIYEPHRVTYPCYVQPKLNGIRALYQGGAFQSRDQLPFPSGLLEHLAAPLREAFSREVILDGELYVHGWPLQRINAAVTPVRQTPTEDTVKVEYHVFDVVDFGKSFESRKELIWSFEVARRIVDTSIKRVHSGIVRRDEDADYAYASYVALGYEGMMYRLGDCPYTVPNEPAGMRSKRINERSRFLSDKNNRVWHLLKRKDWQDDEFLFLSINTTIGELGEPGFQLWLATPEGRKFKVGSGLTHAQVTELISNPRPSPYYVKVKYLVLSSDGIPLNATIHPDHIL